MKKSLVAIKINGKLYESHKWNKKQVSTLFNIAQLANLDFSFSTKYKGIKEFCFNNVAFAESFYIVNSIVSIDFKNYASVTLEHLEAGCILLANTIKTISEECFYD